MKSPKKMGRGSPSVKICLKSDLKKKKYSSTEIEIAYIVQNFLKKKKKSGEFIFHKNYLRI